MVHLCDISYSPRKVVLSYFYPQLHINYQHSDIFAICVEQGVALCSCQENIMGQSMLILQKPRAFWFWEAQSAFCRVQSPSEVQWVWRKGISTGAAVSCRVGCWALMCTQVPDLHGHHRQFSTQEFLRSCLNRCGGNAFLSYTTGWIPFLCCFSYVDLTDSVFSLVWMFCLFSLCTLYIHPKYFLEQLSFFSTALPVIHP